MSDSNSGNSTGKDTFNFANVTCGYVMPISDTINYRNGHWSEIKNLLDGVLSDAGITEADVVSSGIKISTIHKRIVENLYNKDIIICDVSSNNPNVLFELGMRIAFDKPVVIIKDDETNFCFDFSNIEHIEYPKDLRYFVIEEFKRELKEKIMATVKAYKENPSESPILQSFGDFRRTEIDIAPLTQEEELALNLKEIKESLYRIINNSDVDFKKEIESKKGINLYVVGENTVKIPHIALGSLPWPIINSMLKQYDGIEVKEIDGKYATVYYENEEAMRNLMKGLKKF